MSQPGSNEANLGAARKCLAADDLAGAEKILAELERYAAKSYETLALRGEIEFVREGPERAEALLGDAAKSKEGRSDSILNHRFGQALHDIGKIDRAITQYRRSLRLDPTIAEVHRDLGVAYQAKSWPKEAGECFEQAALLDPADELAQDYLGRALRAQGRYSLALKHFARAAWLKLSRPLRRSLPKQAPLGPKASDEALAQARSAFQEKRFEEAETKVRDILARDPRDASALILYAEICGKKNQLDDAMRYADQAIQLRGSDASLHVTQGELYFRADNLDGAEKSFQAALRVDPGHARAFASLALVEQRRDRNEQAEQNARRAYELDPESAHVANVRAFILLSQEKFEEAERFCREAIRLDPRTGGPYLNLGHSLKERGLVDDARAMVRDGAAKLSDEAVSFCHLAAFEFDMGEIEAAIAHTRRALMLEPGHPDAHMTLANLMLLSGRYEEGWPEYEWRRRYRRQARVHEFFRQRFSGIRQWSGIDAEGKALIVHNEQALGEQVLFSSCIPELAKRAKSLTLLCDERLESLLARTFPQVRVVPVCRGDQLRDYRPDGTYDYWCAVGSLPALMKCDATTIPPAVAYLKPDPQRVARWRERLAGMGPGLKVGISWRGGVIATGRFKRSLDLTTLRPVLEVPGVRWISMQYTDCAQEIARVRQATGIEITHWQDGIDDLEEHAALAAALDHRISVCNTLVHLSGAMGLRTWVLSPPATIWPYGLGDRMPWYPSVSIYRQQRYKDWSHPLSRVTADLQALAG